MKKTIENLKESKKCLINKLKSQEQEIEKTQRTNSNLDNMENGLQDRYKNKFDSKK